MSAHLVWIDLEMTGLNPEHDRIIEMATIITDGDLNVIAEGPVLAIRQEQALLDGMDEWNQTHHSGSGLLDRIAREGVAEIEAEAQTLAFIEDHVAPNTAPLCLVLTSPLHCSSALRSVRMSGPAVRSVLTGRDGSI